MSAFLRFILLSFFKLYTWFFFFCLVIRNLYLKFQIFLITVLVCSLVLVCRVFITFIFLFGHCPGFRSCFGKLLKNFHVVGGGSALVGYWLHCQSTWSGWFLLYSCFLCVQICKYFKSLFTEYEFYHLAAVVFYVFLRLVLLRTEMLELDVRCENLESMTIFVFWILLLLYLVILCFVYFSAVMWWVKFICFVDQAFDHYKWSFFVLVNTFLP